MRWTNFQIEDIHNDLLFIDNLPLQSVIFCSCSAEYGGTMIPRIPVIKTNGFKNGNNTIMILTTTVDVARAVIAISLVVQGGIGTR